MPKFKIKSWMIILAVIVMLVLWFFGTYNKLISLSGSVDNSWANVQTSYQRRFDLIPNLVNTVKGYASHEEKLFTEITELRSRWQDSVSKKDVNSQLSTINSFESSLSRLMVVVENYPQLKASENFLSLQDELAGTENRVSVERQRYNEAVKNYNIAIKKIPTSIVASMFGFSERSYFEAKPGAENAPEVKF